MVHKVMLSPDGPKVSEIVYGTWRLLEGDPSPTTDALIERFEWCEELGLSTLDTAEIYGSYQVEAAIGEVFKARPSWRDSFEIITKCGIDVPSEEKGDASIAHYNATAANLRLCAEKSLKLLHTDHLDVLLVHRPDWLTSADETASAIEKLLDDGLVLHVGVSNYTRDQLELLNSRLEAPVVTNQVEVSLLHMDALDDGTLAQCEQSRIRPMAWSPLGGGRLFDPNNESGVRIRKCMDEMRGRYGDAEDDALAFAWVMAHPSKPVPIIGSNQEKRIRSQASAAGIKMERQDWYALWSAAKGHGVP
ncbi:MAG: aldo/keto reductase [Akkermansiaceae bacterium]|nr:aldo/keto reductase [Verrucomicrobiae bacterium]MCP5554039.1 aldo/keto reductase [Akkermansiaceae bacterium]